MTLPFANPTKVAFGGADLSTLFVTTTRMVARTGTPNMGQAMLGGIYSVALDVPGLPDPLFREG